MPAMDPDSVVECQPREVLSGLCLSNKELGRGSYGIVHAGTFRGIPCAVKVMVAPSLDQPALRELLLGPSISHPNLVATYTSRTARMTDGFFDFLEANSLGIPPRDASDRPAAAEGRRLPRMLQPIPMLSGDGFGDPCVMIAEGGDSLLVLHRILHGLKALVDQRVVVIVQEVCDRTNLMNAIAKGLFQPAAAWSVRLARRALLRTAAEVARGLLHLHDAGVVHGDLKPANVLLHSSRLDRRGFTAKLADFGLSHVLPVAATSMSADDCWGSVAYMRCEAFAGRVTRASDVWAVGIILYEMLYGERPYLGLSAAEVAIGVRTGGLTLLWPAHLPDSAGIISLGQSCMKWDPAQRPTLDELLVHLVAVEQCIRAEALLGPEAVNASLRDYLRQGTDPLVNPQTPNPPGDSPPRGPLSASADPSAAAAATAAAAPAAPPGAVRQSGGAGTSADDVASRQPVQQPAATAVAPGPGSFELATTSSTLNRILSAVQVQLDSTLAATAASASGGSAAAVPAAAAAQRTPAQMLLVPYPPPQGQMPDRRPWQGPVQGQGQGRGQVQATPMGILADPIRIIDGALVRSP
ncbi:hypothetical protein HYH03_005281 [Edaphochlamys debaryana]|uniref:Protein kinase domain-containing protein n=1 Tax=Edaphochlamys debaryana TaxID=47281 RepID=A0A835Y8D4_9CHLO|nr:hypothetical protein HYH03_005281 [Edaphochlamys debaryana]|eukprot:KAG2496882.1 hypothetical protein HYH03_005281 [Edaphochlamys debaryana]